MSGLGALEEDIGGRVGDKTDDSDLIVPGLSTPTCDGCVGDETRGVI